MFGCGLALLCIYVVLRLSYTGQGLEGSHQPSSGKQLASGQQGASVVSRLTEGLFVALWVGFSVAVGMLGVTLPCKFVSKCSCIVF